jgi:hypothetical protein
LAILRRTRHGRAVDTVPAKAGFDGRSRWTPPA